MRKPLVTFHDGEPWFDNPLLTIAANKGRSTTMARSHSRRRRSSRRRRARSNYYGAGMLANRPRRRRRHALRANPRRRRRYAMTNRRRRHYRRNPARRHYRRNPSLGGLSLPPLDAVLWVGSGLVVPPIITAQVQKYLPASLQTGWGAIAVKGVAGVVVPGMLLRKFVNQRAGNLFMVGGLASVVMDVIKTVAPGVIPGLGMGAQPMLGSYFTAPGRAIPYRSTSTPRQTTGMLIDTPSRLDPSIRF